MTFKKNEKRKIKVKYQLPSGIAYRNQYRYFKYILHSGAGWYKDIGKATITLHLNDFSLSDGEEISPEGYTIDKANNTIEWNLLNIEPTEKDDIYFQYATSEDKKIYNKATRKRRRQLKRLSKRNKN